MGSLFLGMSPGAIILDPEECVVEACLSRGGGVLWRAGANLSFRLVSACVSPCATFSASSMLGAPSACSSS